MSNAVVTKHLQLWSSTPFVWGLADCGVSVANYVWEIVGVDPALGMRGMYNDRRGCYRWIKKTYGSVLQMAIDGFNTAHLPVTSDPKTGDVGVVKFELSRNLDVIAMCVGGGMWATRLVGGSMVAKPTMIKRAWSVECPQ